MRTERSAGRPVFESSCSQNSPLIVESRYANLQSIWAQDIPLRLWLGAQASTGIAPTLSLKNDGRRTGIYLRDLRPDVHSSHTIVTSTRNSLTRHSIPRLQLSPHFIPRITHNSSPHLCPRYIPTAHTIVSDTACAKSHRLLFRRYDRRAMHPGRFQGGFSQILTLLARRPEGLDVER